MWTTSGVDQPLYNKYIIQRLRVLSKPNRQMHSPL